MTVQMFHKGPLTGGVEGTLDNIDVDDINDGDRAVTFNDTYGNGHYQFDATYGDVDEDLPGIVKPDSNLGVAYTGNGRWILIRNEYKVSFYTNFAAAIAALSSGDTLIIDEDVTLVGSVDASGIFLEFDYGNTIDPNEFILTISSPDYIKTNNNTQIFANDDDGITFTYKGTIFPEWWGAVHNGATDDGPEIRYAVASAAAGSTLVFENGTYAVTGTTGVPITTAINLEFKNSSKLLFSDDDTVYVTFTGVTGVSVVGMTIDAGAPAVRSTNPALLFDNCNETFVNRLRVLSCAGAGYLVSGGSNNSISLSSVEDSLADGFFWTGATTLFSGTNLLAEDTGDDSFSVVSYLTDGAMCSDGNLTGLVSRNSAANAFKVAGGTRIMADVVGYNTGAHGMTLCEDVAYLTYPTSYCKVRGVIETTTLLGVNMVEDCSHIDLDVIIKGAGTDGINIGSAATTAENITLNGEVSASTVDGVEIHTASNINIGHISVLENAGYGIAFVDCTNVIAGTIFAYNNVTGGGGVKDNVYIDGVTNASFGAIESIDDRTPKLVNHAIETLDITEVTFGAVQYSGSLDTDYPFYIYPSGSSNVRLNTQSGFLTFSPADATPSVVGYELWKTSNGVATIITMFDDGYIGQKITVIIGDPNTTIDFTGTNLKGNGGADWSPTTGDFMNCVFDGTNWYCSVVDTTA